MCTCIYFIFFLWPLYSSEASPFLRGPLFSGWYLSFSISKEFRNCLSLCLCNISGLANFLIFVIYQNSLPGPYYLPATQPMGLLMPSGLFLRIICKWTAFKLDRFKVLPEPKGLGLAYPLSSQLFCSFCSLDLASLGEPDLFF